MESATHSPHLIHSTTTTEESSPRSIWRVRDDFYFDVREANNGVKFFERELRHTKAEWQGAPLKLERWQRRIVRRVYGWKERATGLRKYREVFIFVARKNGKTTMSGGFGAKGLYADGEPGASVVCAAADLDQANHLFNFVKDNVDANPRLTNISQSYRRSITVPFTYSSFKVLSSEANTKHGQNDSTVIVDEVHAQPNRDLIDVLVTGTVSRRQPLIVYITTAGYDRNSYCWELYQRAKKIRAGIIDDPHFLPVIYEVEQDDDWEDERNWYKANPNLGVSIKIETLRLLFRRAKEEPSFENTFKRLHLNMWTEQSERWLPMADWDKCIGTVDPIGLRGWDCYAGMDLSNVKDITALVLVFSKPGERHKILPFFWIPEESMRKRSRRDGVPYEVWVKQGLVEATPGNVIDYEYVRRRVNELAGEYNILEIACDPWNATQLITQLTQDGITIFPFRQGYYSLSAPAKELEKLVLSRQIEHGGNPVLRWMASNVAVERDAAGNIKPSKAKSTERIDGISALVNALARVVVHSPEAESVYETRDMLIL